MNLSYDKKLIKNTVNMAWPAVIESFFGAFVGLVDSYMVSELGSTAVAAVGLTTQPKFLGLSLFFAVNVAVSALVARRRGENKKDEANSILFSALSFIVIAAIILSIVFVVFAGPIIKFCGSSPGVYEGTGLCIHFGKGKCIHNPVVYTDFRFY